MRILIFVLGFLFSKNSFSAVGTQIGFSAHASALGGMTALQEKEGTSAFQNPATMSNSSFIKKDPSALQFSFGLIYFQPQFKSISGPVVIENTTTGDSVKTGSVDTDYPSLIGQSIGLNYTNQKNEYKPSLGMVLFLPMDRLALIDSGEPFLPEYALYRSRFQRPEFHFAGSFSLNPNFNIGAGLQFGSGLNAKANVFLQSDSQKSSSMRVLASLKTKAAPYLGLQWKIFKEYQTGLVARMPLNNPESIQINSSGRVIGNLAALDFNFKSLSTAYYEPFQLEWGNKIQFNESVQLFFQLDYLRWSRFKSSRADIQSAGTTTCSPNCGGLQFSSSQYPSFETNDTFVPKIGLEIESFRFGYSYEPSIYKGEKTERSHNLLDPSKHRFSLGYGFKGEQFLYTDRPYTLDFSLQYSKLDSYQMSRKGDEIGANGFEVGGNLFGTTLSLGLIF